MKGLLDRLSLRVKLFSIVGLFVISLAAALIFSQVVIHRVQIGGDSYRGIEQKTDSIDRLARIRLNVNFLDSSLKSLFMDYDEDGVERLLGLLDRQDQLVGELKAEIQMPVAGAENCMTCHSDESLSEFNGLVSGAGKDWADMKNFLQNSIVPELEDDADTAIEVFEEQYYEPYFRFMTATKGLIGNLREASVLMKEETIDEVRLFGQIYLGGGVLAVLVSVILAYFLVQMVVRTITTIVGELDRSVDEIADQSKSTSESSQIVAEMASEMAASIEEISASLEEITSMVQRNDDNSNEAHSLMKRTNELGMSANDEMNGMHESMQKIKEDSDQIATIIGDIESIAFQTNLLALNAAVEAARAGEHGMGFAVVAEEVRNLAQRTANSARNSTELLDKALKNVGLGLAKVEDLARELSDVVDSSQKAGNLIGEIATASHEQTQGISQINLGITEMDGGTQRLAANSEETAAASETVLSQTMMARGNIQELNRLLHGGAEEGRD